LKKWQSGVKGGAFRLTKKAMTQTRLMAFERDLQGGDDVVVMMIV